MNKILAVLISIVALGFFIGCDVKSSAQPQSASGVKKAEVRVQTNPEGLTTEQQNIKDRLLEDNKPGSIKHLYVVSAYSGQVIIYSTVRGKVTSGGKRLNPTTVSAIAGQYNEQGDFVPVNINGTQYRTNEVLQDDGSYGHSSEYLYWWDTKDVFHQHYVSGGQIVHISSQPLAVKGIIINMEISQKSEESK